MFDTPAGSRYKGHRQIRGRRHVGVDRPSKGDQIMGSMHRRAHANRARPILWRRDYEAARKLVKQTARSSNDDERFLALLEAVYEYERNRPSLELLRIVDWAECVFVPSMPGDMERSRRWSDTGPLRRSVAS